MSQKSQSQSQRSSSQNQTSSQRSSVGRKSQAGEQTPVTLAENAVFFILAHHGAHNTIIKQTDLKKHVFPDSRMDEPMKLAKKFLQDYFGYHLEELPSKSKSYILVNFMEQEHIYVKPSLQSQNIVLSLVLAYIFMNRAPVEQKSLLKFVCEAGIDCSKNHPYFGPVGELLMKTSSPFFKDQYLVMNAEDQGIFYEWGERAKVEINPRALVEFVAKMSGVDSSVYKLQLKDIEDMEATPEA